MRRNGECIHLEEGGRVLGAFTDSNYTQTAVKFYAGDKLLLFTDGVTEARSAAGEEFGDQRLEHCVRSYLGRNAGELRTLILNEVTQFCGDNFDDDAALMAVIAE
jgi:serine phosphatase RsbU (regulator of sigma subunit)